MRYEVMIMVKGDDRYYIVAKCSTRDEAEYLLAILNERTWAAPPKIERRTNALHLVASIGNS